MPPANQSVGFAGFELDPADGTLASLGLKLLSEDARAAELRRRFRLPAVRLTASR